MGNVNREKKDLKSTLLKKKYYTIFLALFTLGVNIFAWFAFSSRVGANVEGTVASWEVEFRENSQIVTDDIVVSVTDMKPGMSNFVDTVQVYNTGDVTADFSYTIDSFRLLGHDINLNSIVGVESYLRNYYPFSIYFTPSSTTIGPGSNITFDINIVWPYEDNTKYYKLNEVYEYDRAFKYFNLVGTNYVERSILDQTSYENNLDDLFLGKDDADTYFGMMCHQYEQTSGLPCLTMTMTLKAEQRIS